MAIFTTGLAVLGGAKVLSGLAGARNSAQGMLDAGRDSLLTARYNINKRKIEDQYNQFQTLEQGHQIASQIQTGAIEAEGSAKASAASSGAVVDGGTPQAVLSNIAQQGLHAQMGAILNTKNQMKAMQRDTENQNKTEWNQANAYASGLKRDAKKTIDNSRLQAVADIAETAASVYSAGTAGGTKAFTWGLQGAKVASEVKGMSDARSATGGKGNASLAKSPYDQRGYKPTNLDRFKYNLKNRKFKPFTTNWNTALDWRSNKKTYN
tara:strand:- start:32819 stop:33616 length:798 start_codon:yes stop_codon:yes gene_type:complete